jgi:hypothetical protein
VHETKDTRDKKEVEIRFASGLRSADGYLSILHDGAPVALAEM